MSVLETRQLTRTFGAVVAANSLDVTIQRGEIVGVIGSNGAGKTTFINRVTGYLPATSGDILYEGRSVLGMKPRRSPASDWPDRSKSRSCSPSSPCWTTC